MLANFKMWPKVARALKWGHICSKYEAYPTSDYYAIDCCKLRFLTVLVFGTVFISVSECLLRCHLHMYYSLNTTKQSCVYRKVMLTDHIAALAESGREKQCRAVLRKVGCRGFPNHSKSSTKVLTNCIFEQLPY